MSEEQTQQDEQSQVQLFTVRCTANREEQVLDFLTSNIAKKKLEVYSAFHPNGMRGYIFIETSGLQEAQRAVYQIPYARGILERPVEYSEVEHMFGKEKVEVNIQKGDIAEVISGPFKREKVRVSRIDQTKEEVVVELLEAAVPIPITVKMDAIKIVRRDEGDENADMGMVDN